MDARSLNFPSKVVRDGWSEFETNFLVENYNVYRNEIGKNKYFKSKKVFFAWIADEMATQIKSIKTPDQISSRYYTLTRKPKTVNQATSHDNGIISIGTSSDFPTDTIDNMNDTSIIKASSVNVNEMDYFDTHSPLIIKLDGPALSEKIPIDNSIPMPDESTTVDSDESLSVNINGGLNDSQLTIQNESSIVRMNDSDVTGIDISVRTDKTAGIGQISTLNRKRCSFSRFGESAQGRYSNIATVDNNNPRNTDTFACDTHVIKMPGDVSLSGFFNAGRNISGGSSSLASIGHSTSSRSSSIGQDFLSTGQSRPTSCGFASDFSSSSPRIASVIGRSSVGQDFLSTGQSLPTSIDLASDFLSSSTRTASVIGRSSVGQDFFSIGESRSTSSGFASDFSSSSPRIASVIGRSSVGQDFLSTGQSRPTSIDLASHFLSSSTRTASVVGRSSVGQDFLKTVAPSSRSSSNMEHSTDGWTKPETEWLLDQYYKYIDEVGPMKLFRNKKELWQTLAHSMNVEFGSKRIGEDLSKRVACIINQKKNAVDRNRTSGATRVDVAYEELINKIDAVDDSIEPEVLRDANSVYYKNKESSKKTNPQPNKKPRWDIPNKKAILSTLSDAMLSIEQRRTEREKSKEERRKEMHQELLELLRRREN